MYDVARAEMRVGVVVALIALSMRAEKLLTVALLEQRKLLHNSSFNELAALARHQRGMSIYGGISPE